jgi:hypothetical protein
LEFDTSSNPACVDRSAALILIGAAVRVGVSVNIGSGIGRIATVAIGTVRRALGYLNRPDILTNEFIERSGLASAK